LIEKLPPRERQIFDVLCAHGEATAAEIESLLPDAPSNSAIRAMLMRMEKKGFVTRRLQDQRYVYASALPEPKVRQSALRHLIKTFFNNSPVNAATALLGMSEKIQPSELERLEALIAKARKEQSQ